MKVRKILCQKQNTEGLPSSPIQNYLKEQEESPRPLRQKAHQKGDVATDAGENHYSRKCLVSEQDQ